MDPPAVLKIKLVCRTCLSVSHNMNSIFKDGADDFSTMLQSCSGLNIHALDGFPTNICSDCLNKLQISYQFRQQCNTSHNTLIHLIGANINRELTSKLEHGCELYKCRLCPNQYTILAELQEHFLNDHPYDTNLKELADTNLPTFNGNATEVSRKYSSSYANDLLMDCVEEKYVISESSICGINSKEYDTDSIKDVQKVHVENVVEKNMICEPDILNIYMNKAHNEPNNDDDYEPSEESVIESDSSFEPDDYEESDNETTTEDEHPDSIKSLATSKLNSPQKTKICQICKKNFTTPKNLLIHTRIELRPFSKWTTICSLCHLTFDKPATPERDTKYPVLESLLRYPFTHLDVKPYPCQLCDKRFSQAASRKQHMQTHMEMWSFKCDQCGLAFRKKDHLVTHCDDFHTQKMKKRHVCPICRKVLSRKDHLQEHIMRKHSNKRSYKCPQCCKGFSTPGDRKRHVRQHTAFKKANKKDVEKFSTWFAAKLTND